MLRTRGGKPIPNLELSRSLLLPRRTVLTQGTLTAAAVDFLAGIPRTVLGATPTEGDVLNVAQELEHEAIAAYQIGAESGLLKGALLDTAVLFQGHHKAPRGAVPVTRWRTTARGRGTGACGAAAPGRSRASTTRRPCGLTCHKRAPGTAGAAALKTVAGLQK